MKVHFENISGLTNYLSLYNVHYTEFIFFKLVLPSDIRQPTKKSDIITYLIASDTLKKKYFKLIIYFVCYYSIMFLVCINSVCFHLLIE